MADARKSLRCAIYTRKSSEEGLEQAFNSLDAQREACEAYVLSQRHEGWRALPTHYDDGGYSGGTLERPAVTQLLAEIDDGQIDVVVVYKVDRLTRSLSDFARIVERFDAHGVSFVSVTQQFNTTSSMGRLTLNVLLSFAQFEREVTGERIRDKIAASKRKGMWMGGCVALGYDVEGRKLIVNPVEAKLVHWIYQRYLELGCVAKLKAELDRKCIISKLRVSRGGRTSGGAAFSRGALYTLLHNRLYLGEITHRGKSFPGDHEAILAKDLWEQIHARLRANGEDRRNGKQAADPSLLAGLLYDDKGNRLTPSHAIKKGKRYRYYVSQALIQHRHAHAGSARRIPAHDLEDLICRRLDTFLRTGTAVLEALAAPEDDGSVQQALMTSAKTRAAALKGAPPAALREFLRKTVSKIIVGEERLSILVVKQAMRRLLLGAETSDLTDQSNTENDVFELAVQAQLRRSGGAVRLILPSRSDIERPACSNVPLIRAVVHARCWYERLLSGDLDSQPAFAKDMGVSPRYVRKIYRCAFLAPDIVELILAGRQPAELTLEKLLENLPLDWVEQRKVLSLSKH
jgi:site-specific DNA recombinase